jgi:hypothetical protein
LWEISKIQRRWKIVPPPPPPTYPTRVNASHFAVVYLIVYVCIYSFFLNYRMLSYWMDNTIVHPLWIATKIWKLGQCKLLLSSFCLEYLSRQFKIFVLQRYVLSLAIPMFFMYFLLLTIAMLVCLLLKLLYQKQKIVLAL